MKKNFLKNCLLALIFLASTSLVSCSHQGHDEMMSKVEQNVTITKDLNTNRYGNLYFAGQPSIDNLKLLNKEGFKTVINMRAADEYDEATERKILVADGIHYYNLPFASGDALTDKYISEVTSTIMKHRKEGRVLVHCSSGNRVGIWLGGHFYKDHGLNKDKAVEMAKTLGLVKPMAEEKLNEYLYK